MPNIQTHLLDGYDLEAKTRLGDGFVMNFPGAAGLTTLETTLEELIAWPKPRYRFVKKTYDGFEALQGAGHPSGHLRAARFMASGRMGPHLTVAGSSTVSRSQQAGSPNRMSGTTSPK